MKKVNENKGFTLAELLIVVAVIAVLVAVAIPTFAAQVEKSRQSVDSANLRDAYAAAQLAIVNEGYEDSEGTFHKFELNDWENGDEIIFYYDPTTGNLVPKTAAEGQTADLTSDDQPYMKGTPGAKIKADFTALYGLVNKEKEVTILNYGYEESQQKLDDLEKVPEHKNGAAIKVKIQRLAEFTDGSFYKTTIGFAEIPESQ